MYEKYLKKMKIFYYIDTKFYCKECEHIFLYLLLIET